MIDEFVFSDISASSVRCDETLKRAKSSLEESDIKNDRFIRLKYHKKCFKVPASKVYQFQHLSHKRFHQFYDSVKHYQERIHVDDLRKQFHQVIYQLQKFYNQCLYIASTDSKTVRNSLKTSNYLSLLESDIVSNHQFLRNICERVKFMLKQPWILKSKMIKEKIPYAIRNEVQRLFAVFLQQFTNQLYKIIYTSYFIIKLGLKNMSFNNTSDLNKDEFFNFTRGLEEFNKIFLHVKFIHNSGISRSLANSDCSYFVHFNTKMTSFIFYDDLSIRKIVKTISNYRSLIMSERIFRFLFASKDVAKAVSHKYLSILITETGEINTDDSIMDSLKSTINELEVEDNDNTDQKLEIIERSKNYSAFIKKLSKKMRHTKLGQSVKNEYAFIVSLLEKVFQLTDMLQIAQIKEHHHRSMQDLDKQSTWRSKSPGDVRSDEDSGNYRLDTPLSHSRSNSAASTDRKKSVQWRDSHNETVINKQMTQYRERYLYQVDKHLDSVEIFICSAEIQLYNTTTISHQPTNSSTPTSGRSDSARRHHHSSNIKIGPCLLHKPLVKCAISRLLKEPLICAQFPDELKCCFYNQSSKLQISAKVSIFNDALLQALGFAHDDRLFLTQPHSNACKHFLNGVDIIRQGLQDIPIDSSIKFQLENIRNYLHMLCTITMAILYRTRIKFQKLVSSFNMAQFIYLVYADSRSLLLALANSESLIEAMRNSKEGGLELRRGLKKDLAKFIDLKTEFKTFYSNMQKYFKDRLKRSMEDVIASEFPPNNDAIWCKARINANDSTIHQINESSSENASMSHNYGVCKFKPNPYMNTLLSESFSSIANSLSGFLEKDHEGEIIGMVVEMLLHTLLNYILNQKYRFSLLGTQQLESDINFLLNWLQKYLSQTIFQYVINLPILRQVTSILSILKRQHNFQEETKTKKGTKTSKKGANGRKFGICTNMKSVKVQETTCHMIEDPIRRINTTIITEPIDDDSLDSDRFTNIATQNSLLNSINTSLGNSSESDQSKFNDLNDWMKLRMYPMEQNVVKLNACM